MGLAAFTSVDILGRHFQRALRGYDAAEVDAFLEELARAVDSLERDRQRLQDEAAAAREERRRLEATLSDLRRLEGMERELAEALVEARRQCAEMLSRARSEVEGVVAEAERRAAALEAEAEARAAEVLARAEERARAVLADAERRAAELEASVRQLRGEADSLLALRPLLDAVRERLDSAAHDLATLADALPVAEPAVG
jgi:cell division initiation protein